MVVLFYRQKAAYKLRISDWSSDVCSSDLVLTLVTGAAGAGGFMGLAGRHARNGLLRYGDATVDRLRLRRDRQSVVSGKGVCVSVALGGHRNSNKKPRQNSRNVLLLCIHAMSLLMPRQFMNLNPK